MKKKLWCYLLSGVLCASLIGGTVYAEETAGRQKNIRSSGNLNFQPGTDNSKYVYFESNDLIKLANEIDDLEYKYKSEILNRLNAIGTFFDINGDYTHENNHTENPNSLKYNQLMDGISNSQTVATGTTSNNLSLGKGAWINGEYIVGNGSDVNEAYAKGFSDGASQKQDAHIEYRYHKHAGNNKEGGGCYVWKNTTENAIYCTHSLSDTRAEDDMWVSFYSGGSGTYADCPLRQGHENAPVTVTSDIGHGINVETRGTFIVVYSKVFDSTHMPVNTVTHKIVITPEFSGYVLGCGKTEKTIIGATIVWDD